MKSLVISLYAEGRSDDRFLPVVIFRLVEKIICENSTEVVDIAEPLLMDTKNKPQLSTREEKILDVARRCTDYDVLIVHSDADFPEPNRAINERIQPGFNRSRREFQGGGSNCQLVAIVPVQMTEAWMLVDPEALCEVIGTHVNYQHLGLPVRARDVESLPYPKGTLNEVVRKATEGYTRRRPVKIGSIQEPLARLIDLEKLCDVPSFSRFDEDLRKALHHLRYI